MLGVEDLSWRPCSNHGLWLGTKCECWKGWALQPYFGIGKNVTEVIETCARCAANYIPLPDYYNAGKYCSKVGTINPDSGAVEECGGRGSYVNGACHCDAGAVLTAFENVFTCV
jgi:hypothetical protein